MFYNYLLRIILKNKVLMAEFWNENIAWGDPCLLNRHLISLKTFREPPILDIGNLSGFIKSPDRPRSPDLSYLRKFLVYKGFINRGFIKFLVGIYIGYLKGVGCQGMAKRKKILSKKGLDRQDGLDFGRVRQSTTPKIINMS